MSDVTRILNAIEQGDPAATEGLLPLVYEELRILAAQKMAQEKPGHTLQATALVHEAYIRLVEAECRSWDNRSHFFMAAAEAMRRILIESARHKQTQKRGGHLERTSREPADVAIACSADPDDLLSINDALEKLTDADSAVADVVMLHCFAGLPLSDVAEILHVSSRTAERYWAFARTWLFKEIAGDEALMGRS